MQHFHFEDGVLQSLIEQAKKQKQPIPEWAIDAVVGSFGRTREVVRRSDVNEMVVAAASLAGTNGSAQEPGPDDGRTEKRCIVAADSATSRRLTRQYLGHLECDVLLVRRLLFDGIDVAPFEKHDAAVSWLRKTCVTPDGVEAGPRLTVDLLFHRQFRKTGVLSVAVPKGDWHTVSMLGNLLNEFAAWWRPVDVLELLLVRGGQLRTLPALTAENMGNMQMCVSRPKNLVMHLECPRIEVRCFGLPSRRRWLALHASLFESKSAQWNKRRYRELVRHVERLKASDGFGRRSVGGTWSACADEWFKKTGERVAPNTLLKRYQAAKGSRRRT